MTNRILVIVGPHTVGQAIEISIENIDGGDCHGE